MGPGPSNPYPEATEAFTRPMLGHLDPVFLELLDQTCDRLRQVWGTDNELTLPVSGTGSAGMEAAFVNLVGPATRWSSGSTGCSASGCATSPPAVEPRWCGYSSRGASRWIPSVWWPPTPTPSWWPP